MIIDAGWRAAAGRQAQAVVMLLLGGAIVRAGVTGTYVRYVKVGLRPLLIIAGVLLVATAVMTLWYDRRSARGRAGDSHGHREPRVGWLLLLPVVGLVLVAPPALGSYSAVQSGSVLASSGGSDYAPLPAGDPVPVPVLDYAGRAVYDGGRTLTGRTVQLTGFVIPGPDGPMLARIVLSCCAADGRPVKVGLAGNTPSELPAGTWVTVTGSYLAKTAKDPVNDADVPYLTVTSWRATTAPAQPYE